MNVRETNMKELNEIIKTRNEILRDGYRIENDLIKGVDLNCIGHFGNVVSFEIWCDDCSPFANFNNTRNAGIIAQAFIELFDLTEEDGMRLSEIKNIPCRIILDGCGKVVGFGHFMKDRFVFSSSFAGIGL